MVTDRQRDPALGVLEAAGDGDSMLPVERVIGDGGLTVKNDAARLEIRLPWYRSLPLSTVVIEALTLDDHACDLAGLDFELEGKRWPLLALADLTAEFWFVLDPAFLVLPGLALEPGSTHEVTLTVSLFPPYIPGSVRKRPSVVDRDPWSRSQNRAGRGSSST